MNLVEIYADREYAISTINVTIFGISALTRGKVYRILYHAHNACGGSAIVVKDDRGRKTGWSTRRFYFPSRR
jgi:hypothetical protein